MYLTNQFLMIALGSLRFGGFLFASPIFGLATIPVQIRVLLAFSIGAFMSRLTPTIPQEVWGQTSYLFLVMLKEIGLGVIMGYSFRLIFLVITMTMELAGLQIGFNMANVFDPTNHSQASILAQLGVVLTVIFMLESNLHHDVILTIAKSYEKIPMGLNDGWEMSHSIKQLLVFFRMSMEASIRMVFPIMTSLLVFHIIMGIISKAAPQLNLFFNLSFVVNVIAGMFLIIINWQRMFPTMQTLISFVRSRGFGIF